MPVFGQLGIKTKERNAITALMQTGSTLTSGALLPASNKALLQEVWFLHFHIPFGKRPALRPLRFLSRIKHRLFCTTCQSDYKMLRFHFFHTCGLSSPYFELKLSPRRSNLAAYRKHHISASRPLNWISRVYLLQKRLRKILWKTCIKIRKIVAI